MEMGAHHHIAWFGIEWLMRRCMKHQSVDALCEPIVSYILQRLRRLKVSSCKCLGRNDILTVNMRGRSCSAYIFIVHGRRMKIADPEFSHRYVNILFVEQRVFDGLERNATSFAVCL